MQLRVRASGAAILALALAAGGAHGAVNLPLTWNTYTADVAVDAWAQADGIPVGDYPDSASDSQTDTGASAQAHAWSEALLGEPIPVEYHVTVSGETDATGAPGTAIGTAMLHAASSIDYQGGGTGGGDVNGSITGLLTVGESPEYPAGTTLELELMGHESGTELLWSNWSLEINGSPVPGVELWASVPVTAGETLSVVFNYHQSYSVSDVGYDWGNVDIDMSVTPEPASVSVLALGGLGLLIHRRARFDRGGRR